MAAATKFLKTGSEFSRIIVNMNEKITFYCLYAIIILNKSAEAVQDATFKVCDYDYNIYKGRDVPLKSPSYPHNYKPGSACRYRYTAPVNHNIKVNCTINFDKNIRGSKSESFYIATDGQRNLNGVPGLQGHATFIRHSLFRSVVIAYTSEGSSGNFYCTLSAQSQPCDCGWSVNTKISNGKAAWVNEYPSMVALKRPNNEFFCAAVIISYRFLVTAAHCTRYEPNPKNIRAWVGQHNLQQPWSTIYTAQYFINRIIEHPHYKPATIDNDIALLQTTKDIEFSRGVGPICLPPYSNINNDFAWQNVEVIGWGRNHLGSSHQTILQKAELMITDTAMCKKIYQYSDTIQPHHICSRDAYGKGRDTCQLDSGGPVIFKHKRRQFLIGIISFGKPCAAGKYTTGVNTRITAHLKMIHDNTGRTICNVAF